MRVVSEIQVIEYPDGTKMLQYKEGTLSLKMDFRNISGGGGSSYPSNYNHTERLYSLKEEISEWKDVPLIKVNSISNIAEKSERVFPSILENLNFVVSIERKVDDDKIYNSFAVKGISSVIFHYNEYIKSIYPVPPELSTAAIYDKSKWIGNYFRYEDCCDTNSFIVQQIIG